MATSSSTNFNLTTNEIITEALELLGVIGPGMSVSGEDYTSCLRSLNLMVKAWQAAGFHLWREKEAVVFLENDQASYQLGGSGADHASDEIIATTISADEATNQTTISVTSSSGFVASDIIGIELDTGELHWTTISSVPNSTSVIINLALTSAASSDNMVYVYTSAIGRPLSISSIRLLKDDDTETKMWPISRHVYFSIPNKSSAGNPIQYYVDKQRDNTKIYVYPTPDDVSNRLRITYQRIVEDFDGSTDDADFPQEWLGALAYNLAIVISPKYGKEEKAAQILAPIASQYLEGLKSNDQENVSLRITPNIQDYI